MLPKADSIFPFRSVSALRHWKYYLTVLKLLEWNMNYFALPLICVKTQGGDQDELL